MLEYLVFQEKSLEKQTIGLQFFQSRELRQFSIYILQVIKSEYEGIYILQVLPSNCILPSDLKD